MSRITGRRSTGRLKGFGEMLLDGLDAMSVALNDGPKIERINEIDKQIRDLKQERDHLIMGLTQKYEGYEVSDDYDPHWRKSESTLSEPVEVGDGILVHCKGRDTMSVRHEAHPACPYVGEYHTAHEFILRG